MVVAVLRFCCIQQLQELREKKLAEKKRLIELMKPREDQLCEDSKVSFSVCVRVRACVRVLACVSVHACACK